MLFIGVAVCFDSPRLYFRQFGLLGAVVCGSAVVLGDCLPAGVLEIGGALKLEIIIVVIFVHQN